ncbi:Oxoglutarate/iron-dependent dioxygenase [Arabidopsis thaliana x Arabidopsis arenosa]|uniref:Oxoglutarate/iron-dependent dioxygenase n=1 Tax=Arabidopsis thaliana x Arabidopsis arenosa TaxID=1240361 RepID=A0A8T2C547_9BRAS|nr:Oxoglutarate/iron-dependent dioxygenase [Arabidopsis thaliana x Arabidopsis arenosa]
MAITSETQLPLSLPIIDFSSRDLKPETPEWDLVRSQVRKALEEYGCFEALFDGASMEQRKALFEASKEVFDLPLETKLSTKTDVHYEGYLTIPRVPLQEGMGFYGVDNPNVVNDLTHKLWPQGNIFVSKNVQSFAEKLIELNLKVRTMTLESFGLEKYMEEHLNSANKHFQLLKYKGLSDDNTENKIGFYPHIDRHFLTILCQNDAVDGLEIKTKDGQEWIKVKPSQASSFIVMAGASLHVLLNGGVFPPLHRVVITGKKDRYVAALFTIPKEGVIINAPEEMVDDEHPRLYKPFDFWGFLKFSNLPDARKDISDLTTYCAL